MNINQVNVTGLITYVFKLKHENQRFISENIIKCDSPIMGVEVFVITWFHKGDKIIEAIVINSSSCIMCKHYKTSLTYVALS